MRRKCLVHTLLHAKTKKLRAHARSTLTKPSIQLTYGLALRRLSCRRSSSGASKPFLLLIWFHYADILETTQQAKHCRKSEHEEGTTQRGKRNAVFPPGIGGKAHCRRLQPDAPPGVGETPTRRPRRGSRERTRFFFYSPEPGTLSFRSGFHEEVRGHSLHNLQPRRPSTRPPSTSSLWRRFLTTGQAT